jgi:acetyl-CoA acetyltransferase
MATRSQDDIAIIGWAMSPMERHTAKTETQMLLEVVTGAVGDAGITRAEVDFTCAGSCDYWVTSMWGWRWARAGRQRPIRR